MILGLGYSGNRIAAEARSAGWNVIGVKRTASSAAIAMDDPDLPRLLASASLIVSSAPPEPSSGADPVLLSFGEVLASTDARLFYLSSTGVYGDTGGAWVDEGSPVLAASGHGRRLARTTADAAWRAIGATILRLPGIYGPGRSVLDQVRSGTARRIDRPGHRFNRIHVSDIAGAAIALMQSGVSGVFNIVDETPAEPRHVTEYACQLLGAPPPPLSTLDEAALSPMARSFWSERRLVAGRKLGRVTGYRLRHPDYKSGLQAILAEEGGR
ncbi:MAG: SDR family NAD(P)-dependent oxidoreductase [Thermaurantiacus sp.]